MGINLDELMKEVNKLSYSDFKRLLKGYSQAQNIDKDDTLHSFEMMDTETKLENLGMNGKCPYCGSNQVKKNGTRNNVQRYSCHQCKKSFTSFSGTILEKTRYSWEVWVAVLQLMLNATSVIDTVNILEDDYDCLGIDDVTVWFMRMKILYAISTFKMPSLSGVIQVDETFIRESQKGSRQLVSLISGENRVARRGYKASKYGCMGPEFGTVTTTINKDGNCVAYVTSMGRLTCKGFDEHFTDHFTNIQFLCSDANSVYEAYCEERNIPHYIRPSNYDKILLDSGFIMQNDPAYYVNVEATKRKNKAILKSLYEQDMIDKVTNRGRMTYEEFSELKYKYGLNLAQVNELHSKIKLYINKEMTNVSTEYLPWYISFFIYKRNWGLEHGHNPSSREDAEQILKEVIKSRINISYEDITRMELDIVRPSHKYTSLLKTHTKEARDILKEEKFKFREEDGVQSFDKRKILDTFPKGVIDKMFKTCGYKGRAYSSYTNNSKILMIAKHNDCDRLIYEYLISKRTQTKDEEDIKEELAKRYGK